MTEGSISKYLALVVLSLVLRDVSPILRSIKIITRAVRDYTQCGEGSPGHSVSMGRGAIMRDQQLPFPFPFEMGEWLQERRTGELCSHAAACGNLMLHATGHADLLLELPPASSARTPPFSI